MSHFLVSLFLTLATFFGYHAPLQSQQLFGSTFSPVGGITYTLSGAGVTSSATSITLTSFLTPDGRQITMSMFGGSIGYGVLEPTSNAKIEDITFTGVTQNANGTATLTGVSRGMDFVTPYAASTTLSKSHAGGSYFILSNTAGFYGQQFLLANNAATSTGIITYSSTTPPRYDSVGVQASGSAIATTSEFASIAYVNAVSFAGTTNASESAKGISQFATQLQMASTTGSGSSGAGLVLQAKYSTSSPTAVCGICIPTTDANGKLRLSFLDFTQTWTFTGPVSIAGTSANPLTLNSIAYKFPNTSPASSTVPYTNASGVVSFAPVSGLIYSSASPTPTSGVASTTIINFSIPANTLGTGNQIEVRLPYVSTGILTAANSPIFVEIGFGTASTTLTISPVPVDMANASGELDITIQGAGATNSQKLIAALTNATTTAATTASLINTQKLASFSQTSTGALNFTVIARALGGGSFAPAFATAFAKYQY